MFIYELGFRFNTQRLLMCPKLSYSFVGILFYLVHVTDDKTSRVNLARHRAASRGSVALPLCYCTMIKHLFEDSTCVPRMYVRLTVQQRADAMLHRNKALSLLPPLFICLRLCIQHVGICPKLDRLCASAGKRGRGK